VPKFADWVGVDLWSDDGTGTWRQVAVAHVDPAKVEWARELGRKFPPDPKAPHGVPNVLRTGKPEIYPVVTEEMIRASARSEAELSMTLDLHLRSVIIVPLLAHGRILGALSLVRTDSDTPYEERDLDLAQELARRCASAIDNARLYDAEQQARSAADFANRAKDEFLATVSHELRTPLNAILGWAKMLSSGSLANDVAKQQKAISTIDRNAVAMAQLIEDLLDISRIISGKMRLEVQSVQLGRVIEAAIDAVRPAADAKEIKIVERSDPDAQTANGDPARLQQVVWNLLSNAVKFTPKQGRIDIEVARDESGISISVTDTGKGIDPRFLPHVFDPFRQEDASHTRSRGGLGLGLAITKQLVELHGGSVFASSAGEGKGSTFRVHLPATAIPSPPQLRTGRSRKFRFDSVFEQLPRLQGVHALVVDDEEDARTLLKTVLEEFGARVTLAASVPEALAAIEQEPPSLLVSDIGMPIQDGYDLIREVRRLPPERGGNMPAAALTAYARAEDRRRTIDAGFSMHLSKPIDPAELVAVVGSLTRTLPPK
jgi:signal transduction histidine kinase/CheY-like chemotaxis protein